MPDAPHPLEEKTGGIPHASQRKLARDGKTWTPTEQRQRDQAMKQFCRLEGQSGNSAAYQRGWLAMFGTAEQKARALAEIEAEKAALEPPADAPLRLPTAAEIRENPDAVRAMLRAVYSGDWP